MRTVVLLSGLLLIGAFASAQMSTARGTVSHPAPQAPVAGVPAACSPCLYYSGDYDQNNPYRNAVSD